MCSNKQAFAFGIGGALGYIGGALLKTAIGWHRMFWSEAGVLCLALALFCSMDGSPPPPSSHTQTSPDDSEADLWQQDDAPGARAPLLSSGKTE